VLWNEVPSSSLTVEYVCDSRGNPIYRCGLPGPVNYENPSRDTSYAAYPKTDTEIAPPDQGDYLRLGSTSWSGSSLTIDTWSF